MSRAIRGSRVSFFVCMLLLAACAPFTLAQTITGSVTGSVIDSSGAIVVGAKITLTNTGTSETSPEKGGYLSAPKTFAHALTVLSAGNPSSAQMRCGRRE